MFVKIIDKRSKTEETYECYHYSWEIIDEDVIRLVIDSHLPGVSQKEFDLIRDDTQVYIMNDNGKTIDKMSSWQ